MTVKRFLLFLSVALLCEAGIFAVSHDDLIFLRRPVPQILAGSRETFRTYATEALDRPDLTRRNLETIAATAQGFGMTPLEVAVLDRLSTEAPSDLAVRLRLADALRRAGHLERAERIYLGVLASPQAEAR
jgi:hypothetical protein